MNAEVLKGHLDLLLLATVQTCPAHGYAIAVALRHRSADALSLSEGTLYPALHRLDRAGLLSSRWGEADGKRRRDYPRTRKAHRARDGPHHQPREVPGA